ncbi:hypothetical protein J6590_037248 [Homalodisca vitripennis]|nr:hypothetical protein J6590_037248 [Homalodisca vitripennis]
MSGGIGQASDVNDATARYDVTSAVWSVSMTSLLSLVERELFKCFSGAMFGLVG